MISILFVDDEVNVLEGIRNSLRKRMSQWHLEFAQSGEEALEYMSRMKFDLIVSDMRMPKMDGAALLSQVQKMYPSTSRFVLTGQADQESILRAIPVTHQFIYKPCAPQDLLNILDHTCALHERIQSDEVRQMIGAAKSIPSIPETSIRITEIMANDNSSLTDIGDVIERDPGLCARIIQVSNSAFSGRSKEVTSIREAVSIVGVECVQALALANHFFADTLDNRDCVHLLKTTYSKGFEGFISVSRYLAKHPQRNAAMTAVLLRDIGLIILAMSNPDEADVALYYPDSAVESLSEYEKRHYDITHADIGGHLLALWGTPLVVVDAVACHHSIEDSTIEPIMIAAVHVADVVAQYKHLTKEQMMERINWKFIDEKGLRDSVDGWLELEFDLRNRAA